MVADQRIGINQISHLKCQNTNIDKKRNHRSIDKVELAKLINTTFKGKRHHGLNGKQRAMLYILAVNTGFRANELSSLKWDSFNFNEVCPTVVI